MQAVDLATIPDDLEVVPAARVQRSRLAFAVAVSVAALPVIVLDNLPSTAEARETPVEAAADEEASSSSTTSTAPSTTSTTAAPSTTTTAAPTTTVAPTTTEAVVIQAFRAPPTTAAPPPPPTTAPPAPSPGDPNDPATWDRLAQCESSGNWSLNTGNGYYGGLQFSLATWQSVGGSGYPHQATKAEQVHRGKILQARAGWGQWPACSEKLGYT